MDIPSAVTEMIRHGLEEDLGHGDITTNLLIPVDSEVAHGLSETVAALRRAGVQVDETARPAISTPEAMRTFQQLLFPIIATGFPKEVIDVLKQMTQSPDDGSDLARFARDALQSHREWLGANARRHAHRRMWADSRKLLPATRASQFLRPLGGMLKVACWPEPSKLTSDSTAGLSISATRRVRHTAA